MPVSGLKHLEATAIQVIMAGRPVKILRAYLSPSRPLIGADLTACFGGGLPVLMVANLSIKHVDLNSRLKTMRVKLIRDYGDENSCLIFGPDTPTTNPYNPSATPDVLHIAIVKDLPFPVYLTSCSAQSSDHLPVLIENACRSYFQHPPDRPDFRRTDWAKFQTYLEDQITFDTQLHNGMAIDTCVEYFSGSDLKAVAASTPECRLRDDPRHSIPAGMQDEIRLRNRLWRWWQLTCNTALKDEANRQHRPVTRRLNEGRNDQGSATHETLDPEDQ